MQTTFKLYGVGLGPGDPGLITLRARQVLDEAELIIVPRAASKRESLARSIVADFNLVDKEWLELEFPMDRDWDELLIRYRAVARSVVERLSEKKTAAYLTIGDPMLYSTYIYFINALREVKPEIELETIPGITAAGALAARLTYPLAEKDERFCYMPLPDNLAEIDTMLTHCTTIAIYKIAKRLPDLIEFLNQRGLLDEAVFGSRIGQPVENLRDGREGGLNPGGNEGYLATVIVRRKKK